jgi:hypothetical protein
MHGTLLVGNCLLCSLPGCCHTQFIMQTFSCLMVVRAPLSRSRSNSLSLLCVIMTDYWPSGIDIMRHACTPSVTRDKQAQARHWVHTSWNERTLTTPPRILLSQTCASARELATALKQTTVQTNPSHTQSVSDTAEPLASTPPCVHVSPQKTCSLLHSHCGSGIAAQQLIELLGAGACHERRAESITIRRCQMTTTRVSCVNEEPLHASGEGENHGAFQPRNRMSISAATFSSTHMLRAA